MGRNTEIYQFDKEKASTTLYEDLQNRTFYKRTFSEFLETRKEEFKSSENTISLERILQVVKHDINEISCNDLFEIILFIGEEIYDQLGYESRNKRDEYLHSLYDRFGITLLYELPTSTVCSSYMFQYGNYTNYFPIYEMGNKDGGINIDTKDFLAFNDYMILLMIMILDNKLDGYEYTYTEEEKNIISSIIIENKDNHILLREVESEFLFIKKSLSDNDRHPTPQTVYAAYDFFKQSIEMKDKIDKQKNPRIIILDS